MGYYTRTDRGSVDAIAARLQSGAPLFFGGYERMFYRARELLQARRVRRFFFVFFPGMLFCFVRFVRSRRAGSTARASSALMIPYIQSVNPLTHEVDVKHYCALPLSGDSRADGSVDADIE